MATTNDTTTQLNPGVGGDAMDESAVVDASGTVLGKRPRVVIGGEGQGGVGGRAVVVEPLSDGQGGYALPVRSLKLEKLITEQNALLRQLLAFLMENC